MIKLKQKDKAIAYIEKQKENYIVLRDNLRNNMKNSRNYQKLRRECTEMISTLDYILMNLD